MRLLRALFTEIVIPIAVAEELERHGIGVDTAWMRVCAANDHAAVTDLRQKLDPGEAEAILLAVELRASLILVDERRGRRIASERGLAVMGLLGILAEAKARRLIPECKPILDAMVCNAGFWIAASLRSAFLLGAGEKP